jgi:hypothetical protein
MNANSNESPKPVPLNEIQLLGMESLGLSETNVRTPNFGMHTIDGINELVANRSSRNNQTAFAMLSGLDAVQADGILAGLSRENVTVPNFGEHTLLGIDRLTFRDDTLTRQAAFETLRGLNADQVQGVVSFGLSNEQVNTPNFGQHSLQGIRNLITQNSLLTNENAFLQIAGLDTAQTQGITDFGLSREQVQSPVFSTNILKTMEALQQLNPGADVNTVYNYAVEIPEYQSRAIANFGFSPQELGIQAANNGFMMTETANEAIASGSTVDAAAFLMEEYMAPEEAKATASTLNTTQIIGMIDLGLTLEQVQTPFFENTEHVLNTVFEELHGEGTEIELPLSGQKIEEAREILGRMILDATTKEALQDFNLSDDISLGPDEISLEGENTEPLPYLKPLEGDDLTEFLKYTSSLGELAILNTVQSKIKETDLQESKASESLEEEKYSPQKVAGNPKIPDAEVQAKAIDFNAFTTPSSPVRDAGKDKKRKRTDKKEKPPLSSQRNKTTAGKKPKRKRL